MLDRSLLQLRRIRRTVQIAVGKHVRVATNQLAGDAIDHPGEVETPLLLRQLAVIDHLEQQIAELTRQMLEVAALDGVGDLVSLLQGVGHDGRVALLEIPRAAVLRIAQTRHQVQQVVESIHESSR